MRLRAASRAHFMHDDLNTRARNLPSRFAAGQAAADDMNGFHIPLVTKPSRLVNRAAARR